MKIKIHCHPALQEKMNALADIKRTNLSGPHTLIQLYVAAFDGLLSQVSVPAKIPHHLRSQAQITVPNNEVINVKVKLNSLSRIAESRQQPLAAVIEEALEAYLSLPENYLGMEYLSRKDKGEVIRKRKHP